MEDGDFYAIFTNLCFCSYLSIACKFFFFRHQLNHWQVGTKFEESKGLHRYQLPKICQVTYGLVNVSNTLDVECPAHVDVSFSRMHFLPNI